MTRKDIEDILLKEGIRLEELVEDGQRVRVTTDKPIPEYTKQQLLFLTPIAVTMSFAVKDKARMPLPKSLYGWYKLVSKEIKR